MQAKGDSKWIKRYSSEQYSPEIQPRTGVFEFFQEYFSNKEQNQGLNLLDAGCGTGRNAAYAYEMGFNPYAFDLVKGAVDSTQRLLINKGMPSNKALGQAKVGDLRSRFPDFEGISGYDVIISFGAIHNIEKREGEKTNRYGILNAFGEIDRLLKPGGLAYISVKSINQRKVSYRLGNLDVKFQETCPLLEEETIRDEETLIGPTYRLVSDDKKEDGLSWHLFTQREILGIVSQLELNIHGEIKERKRNNPERGIPNRVNLEFVLKKPAF